MRFINRILALAATTVLIPGLASADPWKDESGHGRGEHKVKEKYDQRTGEYKYGEKGPGYKYEYKVDRHGRQVEEYKGRGGPPPWARAHGPPPRGPHNRQETVYAPPFGIDAGRCNREVLGAAIGGAAGGDGGSLRRRPRAGKRPIPGHRKSAPNRSYKVV